MSKLPDAAPIPDKPPLHLKGGNVVLASPTSISEACFSVPAVRALRNSRPTATLALLTPESIAPLWKTVAGLNHILEYPDGAPVKQIVKVLRGCRTNLESSIAWEPSDAAVAFAKSKVPQRLGYDLKPLARRLTDRLPVEVPDGPIEHRVRFYMGLMVKLGVEGYVPGNFATPPLPPRPIPARIGLVPGSDFGEAYRWPVDRFRELGEALLARHHVELVIMAYPGHAHEATELDKLFDGKVKNYGSQFDLPALLEALPHCSFLVSNDGAVTHLAAHLGVPTVALFGPGDLVATRPLGRQHIVLSQHLDCSPCTRPTCPLKHHRCLEELTVQRVYQAAAPFLQPHPQAAPP